jgi:ADP-heptose:LPS heptosyltransferase
VQRRYGSTHEIIWSVKKEYVYLYKGISGIRCLPLEELEGALKGENRASIIFFNPDTILEAQLAAYGNVYSWGKTLIDTRKRCTLPEAMEARNLLGASGYPLEEIELPLVIPSEDLKSVSQLERPYIVIHIGAYQKKPTLPVEIIMELTAHFHTSGYHIVWLGIEDRNDSEWLGKLSMDSKATAIGRPSIPELYEILKGASGVIGRDSGVCHLSAAIGIPTVSVIGPLGRRLAAKRWSPMGLKVKNIEFGVKARFWESDLSYQRRYFATVRTTDITDALEGLMDSAKKD